jgi:hypothetical protein
VVIEIAQSWLPQSGDGKFRGGCTLIIDLERRAIRYVVRKRVGHPWRIQAQQAFQAKMAEGNLSFNYFGKALMKQEPFAVLHRGI